MWVHVSRMRRARFLGAKRDVIPIKVRVELESDLIHSRNVLILLWVYDGIFLFVDPFDQRTRVMSCTQFVSQDLPASGEAACSQWPVVGVMLDQRKRAR